MNTDVFTKTLNTLESSRTTHNLHELSKAEFMLFMDRLTELLIDETFTKQQLEDIAAVYGDSLHPFKQHIDEHGSRDETFLAKSITQLHDLSKLDDVFWCYLFPKFIAAEVALAGVTKDSRVLHIGSGPVPLSAIYYGMYADCEYVGIEKDAAAIVAAEEMLERINLQKRITFKQGLGEQIDLTDYTHIVIGWFTFPKKDIYAHVHKHAPADTKIIGRINEVIGSIFYEDTTESIARSCGFIPTERAEYSNKITTSVLFERM